MSGLSLSGAALADIQLRMIGGGALRDLLIGAPVVWVTEPGSFGVCIAVAGAVWALGERRAQWRALSWLDALGRAAYCVVGASQSAAWGWSLPGFAPAAATIVVRDDR